MCGPPRVPSEAFRVALSRVRKLPRRAVLHVTLGAKVFEATNPDNHNYDAEIDEVWAAPNRWRRTIRSAKFSEVLNTNRNKVSEQITGDYYPLWLHTLVNAIFDPGARLQGVDMTKSSDNAVVGDTQTCRRFGYRVGMTDAARKQLANWTFKPALNKGEAVQLEGILTFAYQTRIVPN